MTEHVIYILSGNQACAEKGPVFMGVTPHLTPCLRRHRAGRVSRVEFRLDRLIYTEKFTCSFKADARLRALKSASREWLDALITASNPNWESLDVQETCFQPIEMSQAA